jgi:ABC-type amino acid transport substrate-binding protein
VTKQRETTVKTYSRWLLATLAAGALLVAGCAPVAENDVPPPDDDVDVGALELEQDGLVRVGSDIDFPPFEFYENGEPQGFDVDLMHEVADRLGLEVEWVDADFGTIFTQLAGGEFDAVISAVTITEEREEIISFTDPYFAADQALVVVTGSDIQGVDDLDGMRVGAQEGTTGLDYAEENFTEAEVVAFPTYPAAFAQLEAGQIDAVLADLPVAAEFAEGEALDMVEEVQTDELYGIGVQQEATNLLQAFNSTLADIIDDGTYEDIYSRWFEGDPPEQFRTG